MKVDTTNDSIINRELHISKKLNAPVELVWKVWTMPEHIANWWGPEGFTNTIHTMDVTKGGEWRLTMHGADGKSFPNKSIFLEIVLHEKIVFQHFNPDYIATIVFTPEENGTLMEWTMLFATNELFETVVKVFKADEGFKQNVEKLTSYLETQLK
jgi:uncharacterized protein YndB with AHSA1/START domain